MEIGIIGFPKVGKTTLFKVLTGVGGDGKEAPSGQGKLNLGVAKLSDPRLHALVKIFKPQRTVPAEVRYIDVPGAPEGLGKSSGISGEFLNRLQGCDALLHVVRAFRDPSVAYHRPEGIDSVKDIQEMDMELAFADLGILEKRLQRLEANLKGARAAERSAITREKDILTPMKEALEREVPIRQQPRSHEDDTFLKNFQFLTAKPLITVLNGGEEDIPGCKALEEEISSKFGGPGRGAVAVCGKLEMELLRLGPEEQKEFRESLGLGELGLERIVQLSLELLGLISFFTVGPDEVKAWNVERDAPAVEAAGKIHSDIERGFIRAEVIAFDDMVRCGSMAEVKKKGLLRLEGKSYPVKDGDVVTILFNV